MIRGSLAIALLALACSSAPVGQVAPSAPASSATASSSAPDSGSLPPPTADRVPLGLGKLVDLEAALVPIHGSERALVVRDFANEPMLSLQLISDDKLEGPVVSIPGAHLVLAYEPSPGVVMLATWEQGRVCLRPLGGASTKSPVCAAVDADVAVGFGDRLLLLAARTPLPEEDEEPTVKRAPPKKPPPKPAKKPRPKAKRKAQEDAKKRLFESGKEVELFATTLAADGTLAETASTELKYVEAMAGMSLIGAGARGKRVDVLFYEHAPKKGKEPRGKLGFAQLDDQLKLDQGTKKAFGESRLEAGFLADHADVRLLTLARGSIALGTRGPRGKCDVTVVAPFIMQMIPDQRDCVLDPDRFLTVALAKRAGLEPDLPEPPALFESETARTLAQPSWDVGRSIRSTKGAWAFQGPRLMSFANRLEPAELPRPLRVEQSRVRWGNVLPDGAAIAETDEGLVLVDTAGALTKLAGVSLRRVFGPDRADVASANRGLVAKIGETWIQARGELRPLAPRVEQPGRKLPVDTSVLVGGEKVGLLLELHGSALSVASVDDKGATTALGALKSPVGAGFDAAMRRAGGAIVVGPDRAASDRVVAFVIDARGRATAAKEVPGLLASDRYAPLRVQALPGGGALLMDAPRTLAVWLDDDGKERARTALPAATGTCLDGRPAPSKVPSITPGELLEFTPSRVVGTCLVGDPGYRPDGTVVWFGATTRGFATRAELGVMAAKGTALGSGVVEPAVAPSPAPQPSCPSDMVLVPDDLCVDRFEGALLDETSGVFLSPDYPATPNLLASVLGDFATKRERVGNLAARSLPLPFISRWQRTSSLSPVAESRAGITPHGFVTGLLAKSACEAAGKRLCKHEEWKKACRGQDNRMFPYGAQYEKGTCNVNGLHHPGAMLHDNASILHLDPRLHHVTVDGKRLLWPTGSAPRCASRWGDDAIFDMVGNLDEWVDEKGGGFAGGFYARGTTAGCEALITAHPPGYLDYSTGIRCCRDAAN